MRRDTGGLSKQMGHPKNNRFEWESRKLYKATRSLLTKTSPEQHLSKQLHHDDSEPRQIESASAPSKRRDFSSTRTRTHIMPADVDELTKQTLVHQHVANYLEEAVRSFTSMRSKCRSSRTDVTFRRQLLVFRVVRCSSVHCFQARITVELSHCTRAPIAQWENPPSRKPIILPRSNSVSCWNFS
ncbi:uncharacterized protein TNCV_1033471 [Trichonephila clavipes]|nr:uncharacterized protein TNCV_1033471 [Trichonephila clavipes]